MAKADYEVNVIEKIIGKLQELKIEIKVLDNESGKPEHRIIRGLYACKGNNEGHVVSEICMIDQQEESPYSIVQIFTTVMEYDDEIAMQKLLDAADEWNFYSPMGAFGIYEETNHFYCKYNLLLHMGLSVADAATMVIDALNIHLQIVASVFDDVVKVCAGGDIETDDMTE